MKPATFILARKIIASMILIAFFLLFTIGAPGLEYLASWQIGPAILAGGFIFSGLMAAITLLFGRVYCSLLCPLGLGQDILLRKKRRFGPLHEYKWLRYALFTLFWASMLGGFLFIYDALDPYGAFGRIMTAIFGPLIMAIDSLWTFCLGYIGNGNHVAQPLHFPGWPALITALTTLCLLVFLVLSWGRIWCNYCPVGTTLGLLARKALFRIRLHPEKCVSCGVCQKSCKTGCIDIGNQQIDNSRCLSCLDCVASCPKEALAYSGPQKAPASPLVNSSKRAFLQGLLPWVALASTLPTPADAAEKYRVNRPDVIPEPRSLREREAPITPPGSRDLTHFRKHCIGCQLCAKVCPNNVLVTSAHGPGLLQPGMSYEQGYCRPNCVKCGDVCPAGAIDRLTTIEKGQIRIGFAKYDLEQCIIHRDDVPCTACQRICPREAITLQGLPGQPAHLKFPHVDEEKCTGCGACEYICPARPLAAIAVHAYPAHKTVGGV